MSGVPIRLFRAYMPRLAFVLLVFGAIQSAAGTEKVLHEFSSQQRGTWPLGLASDSSGNLFGTTQYGGAYNHGTVFEFYSRSGGGWTETVLHSFAGGSDGSFPYQLVLDAEGNIYGTTGYGGSNCSTSGCGTVIKLSRNSNGGWTESVIYSFQASDGYPTGALLVDHAGNLYGAESNFASATFSVFELTESSGKWTKTILYTFSGGTIYGVVIPALAMDAAGNLYGTLTNGVSATEGLVFELTPSSGGSWTEKTLYTFLGGTAGGIPTGPLLLKNGNLYGATLDGGESVREQENGGCGVVFELAPRSNGQWLEKVIYTFQGNQSDGPIYPALSAFDSHGSLYGFTNRGGTGVCSYCGSVFELTPNGNGPWTEAELWDFDGQSDGDYPTAVALGPAGKIYGTTTGPGAGQLPEGQIFELTPQSSPTGASTLNVLYIFPFTDGEEPSRGLIADAAGNMYGTTAYGGLNNVGSIFKMSPVGNGWKESLIYSFGPASRSAYYSASPSSMVFDAKGNLYGTTQEGGANHNGSVFELSPAVGGIWQEKDLVSFTWNDGLVQPIGGVVFDKAGHIYGVAVFNGAYGYGGVFQLTQGADGQWTAAVIYNFKGSPSDGAIPQAGLVIDSAGNLYGTTERGGSGQCNDGSNNPAGCGVAFELSYAADTGWTETLLHSFIGVQGSDGAAPTANLILDGSGNLYGTTVSGGSLDSHCVGYGVPSGCGTVFELTPSAAGWNETVLYKFKGGNGDGTNPAGGLTRSQAGNLYGTTSGGGAYRSGTLFKLTPAGSSGWTATVLHNFGNGSDGKFPNSSPIFGAGNNLFGVTPAGGTVVGTSDNGQGTVFEVVP